MTSALSLAAGALFGLAVILIYIGGRQLVDGSRDAAARRKGFWPLNAGLIALALSVLLVAN